MARMYPEHTLVQQRVDLKAGMGVPQHFCLLMKIFLMAILYWLESKNIEVVSLLSYRTGRYSVLILVLA